MKVLKLRQSNNPIKEADISDLEANLQSGLPQDYRAFLISTNGGTVSEENEYFPLKDEAARKAFSGTGFVVEVIFPVKSDTYPDGEIWNEAQDYRGRIPNDTIPIAKNPFGDLILLGLSGLKEGIIYAWDHEREGIPGRPRRYDNVYQVFSSFGAFIDALGKLPSVS